MSHAILPVLSPYAEPQGLQQPPHTHTPPPSAKSPVLLVGCMCRLEDLLEKNGIQMYSAHLLWNSFFWGVFRWSRFSSSRGFLLLQKLRMDKLHCDSEEQSLNGDDAIGVWDFQGSLRISVFHFTKEAVFKCVHTCRHHLILVLVTLTGSEHQFAALFHNKVFFCFFYRLEFIFIAVTFFHTLFCFVSCNSCNQHKI